MSHPAELPSEANPERPLAGWKPADAIEEMEAACRDATGFLKQMAVNEQTRKCWWADKTGTGRKENTKTADAKPYAGAPDHEVHLTQTVMNRRNAARVAALAGGSLSVTPMEAADAKQAALMRQVLRYYLAGPMRTEFVTHGLRAGSYADRFRAALLYVGWKEERGVEAARVTRAELAGWLQEEWALNLMQTAGAEPEMLVADGLEFETQIDDPGRDADTAAVMLRHLPGVAERASGERQALRALGQIRAEGEATLHGSYVKRSSPCWEALRPFVDVFFPVESLNEDGMESCRWIARVRWRSAQWIKEQAALHGWNPKWVEKVLKDCKGRASLFHNSMSAYPWALNGAGVNWGTKPNGETRNHLYQIIDLWDRSVTSDGLAGIYHTVMHADVPDLVASRSLRADWDGCYPFVPFSFSRDETLLLDGLSVPEVTMTKEQAVKEQWDARTACARLTAYPIWTGDEELDGLKVVPNAFLPAIRGRIPEALKIPQPDGRSIEVEQTLRGAVNEFFGFTSENVPDSVAMMMGQAEMDWFMLSISQAVARTARLIQQYMPPLKGARITGSAEMVTATAAEVRGSFDFQVRFNVRSLDVEWTREYLGYVKDLLVPLDNRGQINTLPLLESGFNMLDPALAAACLPATQEAGQRQTLDLARAHLAEIFTGGAPDVTDGMDFGGLAQAVTEEMQRSPLRQQSVIGGQQVHRVLTSYLGALVSNQQQHGGENARTGRTLSEDPLKVPSAAEALLAALQELPDGVSLWQAMNGPQSLAAG